MEQKKRLIALKKMAGISLVSGLFLIVAALFSLISVLLFSRFGLAFTFKNLCLYFAVGFFLLLGAFLVFVEPLRQNAEDCDLLRLAVAWLRSLLPFMNKRRLIITAALVVLIPFGVEGVFTILELSNPEGTKHAFSFFNVLVFFVFALFAAYVLLLLLGKPKEKEKRISAFFDSHFTKRDFAILCVSGTCSFFLFEHVDLFITAGNSFAILSGHVGDFYAYLNEVWGQANYMITTFLVFAAWNVPVRLVTGGKYYVPSPNLSVPVIWWNKTLIVLCFIASVILVAKIARRAGFDDGKIRLVAFVYSCLPPSFFSVFIFGQYDVFSVVFLLLGILYLLDNRPKASALLIGIGATFKITILLFYVPVLLLKKKRLRTLFGLMLITLSPYAVLTVLYSGQAAFSEGVSGFGALNYIVTTSLSVFPPIGLSLLLFFFLFVGLCCYALAKDVDDQATFVHYSAFLGSGVGFSFFGLCMHHPQWFLTASPFVALLFVSTNKSKLSGLFLTLSYCSYFLWVLVFFSPGVDSELLNNGLFYFIVGRKDYLTSRQFLNLPSFLLQWPTNMSLFFTLHSAFLLAFVILGAPHLNPAEKEGPITQKWQAAKTLCILPTLLFVGIVISCALFTIISEGQL